MTKVLINQINQQKKFFFKEAMIIFFKEAPFPCRLTHQTPVCMAPVNPKYKSCIFFYNFLLVFLIQDKSYLVLCMAVLTQSSVNILAYLDYLFTLFKTIVSVPFSLSHQRNKFVHHTTLAQNVEM